MSEQPQPNPNATEKFKRKRKKSFLKNARKYAKKGCYGRGSELDADTYQYFVRIMEAYKEGFDTEEDKSIFVNNVFEQTVDQEINCCCNQVGCRVVEILIPFANEGVLQRYIDSFSKDLRPLCSDRFASHVVEALVHEAATRSLVKSEEEQDFKANCREFVVKVSRFLLNNLEDYLWDTYGNHVIRTCLESLAQIPKENKQKNVPKIETVEPKCELPDEYAVIIKDYSERLMQWPQFYELCQSDITSGFLQVLLRALRKTDKKVLKKMLEKLLVANFAPPKEEVASNSLPSVFLSKSAMMALETALEVAKTKKFTQIFLGCFSGRLVKLATTRSTNFTVQKLIINCKEKSEFEMIFDELSNSFREIIELGHTGIIWGLAQGCKNLATKQGSFVQSLLKGLDCVEEDRQTAFIFCLCKFIDFEAAQKQAKADLQKEKLNLHGTLILQLLLDFNKPIRIVNGLLNMEQSDLKGLFSNTMGSHIVDSYVKSGFVGEKSREKLVRKMRGTYQELASSKYGSRSFEALWNAATIKNKQLIMEEMSYKDGSWSNSEFGKIIAGKVNLVLYKRNKEDWKNSMNTVNKAQELFADILK